MSVIKLILVYLILGTLEYVLTGSCTKEKELKAVRAVFMTIYIILLLTYVAIMM